MDYLKKNTTIDVDEPAFYSVDISSDDIFNYPFLLITGHGNIEFSQNDVVRLRKYCHKIYKSQYTFPNGLPKIHEHDAKPPQGFGIYINNRLCVYYTYETNISDGWADTKEHQDPPEKKEEAFKMGTNIIVYALMN